MCEKQLLEVLFKVRVSTLTVHPNELERYNRVEKKPKQLRMCCTKRVVKLGALARHTDVEVNDSMIDQVTNITYDKSIALVKINCPAPEWADNWVMKAFQALSECGVTFELVAIQPRQLSFTIQNQWLEQLEGCLAKLECHPEVVTECVRLSIRCVGGQPLLNTITLVAETMAQVNIPLLRLAESYGLIEVLVGADYISEVRRSLEKRFGVSAVLSISGFSRI